MKNETARDARRRYWAAQDYLRFSWSSNVPVAQVQVWELQAKQAVALLRSLGLEVGERGLVDGRRQPTEPPADSGR